MDTHLTSHPPPTDEPHAPPPQPRGLPCYRVLCRRLNRLRLPSSVLIALVTYGELQVLARHQYYLLAHQYHPDHQQQHKGYGKGQPLKGTAFMCITATWHWLRAFPAEALLPTPAAMRHAKQELGYEMELPWHLERQDPRMAWGWQRWYL